MSRMTTAVFILTILLLAPLHAEAQGEVKGKVTVTVGKGLGGYRLTGINKTGRTIEDFVITIADGCGVKITGVGVPGYEDWDVDDDEDGSSNEPGDNAETDDKDASPGTKARVDNKGKGKEGDGQKNAGKGIKKNKTFEVVVTFDGPTTDSCSLCIAPTDAMTFGVGTAMNGIAQGGSVYMIHNHDVVGMGLAVGDPNETGGMVTALEIHPQGGLLFNMAYEVDAETSDVISAVPCMPGAPCMLPLMNPVPPGETVAFDVGFDVLNDGEWSLVIVEPVVQGFFAEDSAERSDR